MHQFMLENPCIRIGYSFHFSGLLWKIKEADLLHLMICQMAVWLFGKKEAFILLLLQEMTTARIGMRFVSFETSVKANYQ